MLAGMVTENGKKMESVVPMEQINFVALMMRRSARTDWGSIGVQKMGVRVLLNTLCISYGRIHGQFLLLIVVPKD